MSRYILHQPQSTGHNSNAVTAVDTDAPLHSSELVNGESELLKPFRFDRYAKGDLHPTSHSPFPWS